MTDQPEILSRPGEEGISDSDPSTTLEGGRGAADAPTPLEQIVKAVLERAADAATPHESEWDGDSVEDRGYRIGLGVAQDRILALPADQIAAELAHLWPGAIKGGENNA